MEEELEVSTLMQVMAGYKSFSNFLLCCRTRVGQRLPQDLITKVVGFILSTRRHRYFKKYSLSYIGNIDETPLWLDMPGDMTIARQGEWSIPSQYYWA